MCGGLCLSRRGALPASDQTVDDAAAPALTGRILGPRGSEGTAPRCPQRAPAHAQSLTDSPSPSLAVLPVIISLMNCCSPGLGSRLPQRCEGARAEQARLQGAWAAGGPGHGFLEEAVCRGE